MANRLKFDSEQDKLKDLVYPGITEDYFSARRAVALRTTIDRYAREIDAANFGLFFGTVNLLANRQIIISVSKLYEPPNDRYPIRSIPVILNFLEEHCRSLPIRERPFLERKLVDACFRREALAAMPDHALTRMLVAYLRSELPEKRRAHFHDQSQTLSALVLHRDKVAAHNEQVDTAQLSSLSLEDISPLLDYAADFISLVGFSFAGIVFEDNSGSQFFFEDADRVSLAVERLLQKACVI